MSSDVALNYFISQGWTKEQAAGIVGNLYHESGGLNTKAVGDGGLAYGLAQWHPDRQAIFKNKFGKDIRNSTFQEQLAFVQYELTNNESSAGASLKKAKTTSEATKIFMQQYERPANNSSYLDRLKYANKALLTGPNSVVSEVLGDAWDVIKGPFMGGDSIIGKGQELLTGENTFDNIWSIEYWQENAAKLGLIFIGGVVIVFGLYQLIKEPVNTAISTASGSALKLAKG